MCLHHTPSYLIAPRYLAGPDETVRVLSDDWQARPFDDTWIYLHRSSEGQLVEALHPPILRQPRRDVHGHVTGRASLNGWEFTGRPAPGAPRTWRVRFTPTTPPELPAAFARAVTQPPTTLGVHTDPTSPLDAAEWICDRGQYETTWYSIEGQCLVTAPTQRDTCTQHAADPGRGDTSPSSTDAAHDCASPGTHACTERWVFAAQHSFEQRLLWVALAEASVPNSLLHALCREITREEPVPRDEIPGPDAGPVLVHRLR
ncbi:DUF317 domain-containing protein [Streptomyces smyrnaeus]|uniref:DUF317 domain-containing protein n=1 Tax=Streptomyces smyrnaeus TaxID=1387713 RepID=UPI0033F1A0F2